MESFRSRPHALVASLCAGIALANVIRLPTVAALACALGVLLAARPLRTSGALTCVLAVSGWWWGSVRLDRLDHSALSSQIGRAAKAVVVVTAAPRLGRFQLKMPVRVRRFGALRLDEPAQLELPLGRAPPAGGILEVAPRRSFLVARATGSTSELG